MSFPLTFSDINLLLAITALILLVTSEMLSPYYSKINIRIEKKKLRNAGFTISFIFLVTIAIQIISLILIS